MFDKKDIQLSLAAYTKILCHVMQYPYTAVNGILLTKDGCEDKEMIDVVDCVPLFHYNIPLSPMFIVALTQIEEYASNRDLKICGYYHANEYYSDSEVGAVATKIADKIAENCEDSADCCLLIVENDKLSCLTSDLPLKAFLPSKTNERVDWRSCDKPRLQYGEKGLQMGPEVVKKQLYSVEMEQVDQIIIVTLQDVGLDIDTQEIVSISQFTDSLVVQSVARCLNIINSDKKLPEKLPEGMARRYRVGIELANACKELGYKADLGYETFLYSNEVEIRRLLMFLVERLPRSRQDADDSDLSVTSSVKVNIAKELRRQLQQPWLPARCHGGHVVWDGNRKTGSYHYVGGYRSFSTQRIKKKDKCLGLQCAPNKLLSSLLQLSTQLNQEIDVSNLTFTRSQTNSPQKRNEVYKLIKQAGVEAREAVEKSGMLAKMETVNLRSVAHPDTQHSGAAQEESTVQKSENTVSQEEEERELIRQHEKERDELSEKLEMLKKKQNDSRSKIETANKKIEEMEKKKKEKEEEVEKLKGEFLLKRKTLQLVPQEKNAVTAMKEKVQAVKANTANVKTMWITKEKDLVSEVEELQTDLRTKQLQTTEYIEDVKLMREEISELVSSIEVKESKVTELEEKVRNLPSSINRNTHTKKILDIVDKIKRQKEHINTILAETKVVQKEINNLNGKIERSFIETDEMIFRDAKHNDQCRKAYKLLANLQSEFNALVRGLDDIGTINREVRDVEDLLLREREKNTGQLIEKVSRDLAAVVGDNDKIIAAVKSAKAKNKKS